MMLKGGWEGIGGRLGDDGKRLGGAWEDVGRRLSRSGRILWG